MKSSRIELSPQVADFLRKLAPAPRKTVRMALRALAQDEGDILPLEKPLEGFYRLRVGRYRVVFHYVQQDGIRVARCDYAERRPLVYECFRDWVEGHSPGLPPP